MEVVDVLGMDDSIVNACNHAIGATKLEEGTCLADLKSFPWSRVQLTRSDALRLDGMIVGC